MLVPMKKWLESEGRNFRWRFCEGPVLTASLGDRTTESRGEAWREGGRQGGRNTYQSHLSAVWREELWSNFTLPPGRSPAREGRGRGEKVKGEDRAAFYREHEECTL